MQGNCSGLPEMPTIHGVSAKSTNSAPSLNLNDNPQSPMKEGLVTIQVRALGLQPYVPIWEAMKQFTANRDSTTEDELWLLEHPPVYTQGQAGKPEHVLNSSIIPIVQSDRGGQVTYHGPGQLVMYTLIDIQRRQLGVRTLVSQLEQVLIDLLALYQIKASIQCGAPGVYVEHKKIASIGIAVKKWVTYHGVAVNVSYDPEAFKGLNPCGFSTETMVSLEELAKKKVPSEVYKKELTLQFIKYFSIKN